MEEQVCCPDDCCSGANSLHQNALEAAVGRAASTQAASAGAASELQDKLVYVAYFYTRGDCVENTHDAIMYGEALVDMGIVPYVPHVSLMWHLIAPRPAEFWYGYDLAILRRCDAMIVMGDAEVDSFGVQLEVQACMDWGIPVYRQDEV